MAANIVSSAPSGRFYYGCAGAAGLLAGLAIVYWFPALAGAAGLSALARAAGLV